MTNREKLRQLLIDVFLLEPAEFRFDLRREEIDTWDSLGVISIGVGLKETFGHHPTPAEAMALSSVADIVRLLEAKGISLDG